jgi:hypothetical protein
MELKFRKVQIKIEYRFRKEHHLMNLILLKIISLLLDYILIMTNMDNLIWLWGIYLT